MQADKILTDAAAIVAGARNTTHGEKERSFGVIANLWNAYLQGRRDPAAPISARDVVQCMVLLKIARTVQGQPVTDHFLDAAGYSAIAGEIAAGEAVAVTAEPVAAAPGSLAWLQAGVEHHPV